jgi:hypothetical protein
MALGGSKTFAAIGVPGFANGGIIHNNVKETIERNNKYTVNNNTTTERFHNTTTERLISKENNMTEKFIPKGNSLTERLISQGNTITERFVPKGNGGVVPGIDLGYDSIFAMLRPNEVVLNKQQQMAIGGPQVLANIGVPEFVPDRKYSNGGFSTSTRLPSAKKPEDADVNIYVVMDKEFSESMVETAKDKVVHLAASDYRNRGKLYSQVNKR